MHLLSAEQVDSLNSDALRPSLNVQIQAVEHLGPVEAALCGMHIYLFHLDENSAHIDRLVRKLQPLTRHWNADLAQVLERASDTRIQGSDTHNIKRALRAEAMGILALAATLLTDQTGDPIQLVKRYQIYACQHLLGQDSDAEFFSDTELRQALGSGSFSPEVVYLRLFAQRLRKPELIQRELSRHFAPLDDLINAPEFTLIEPDPT